MRIAVRFSGEKTYLCLDAEHEDLMRVRAALAELGLTGAHFPRINHQGRTYSFGMYLRHPDESYATPEEEAQIVAVVGEVLSSSTATSPEPDSTAGRQTVPARSTAQRSASGQDVAAGWSMTIAQWEQQLARAMSQFPQAAQSQSTMVVDEGTLFRMIERNNLRRASKEIERWRAGGVAPEAIARAELRLLHRRQTWDAAIDYAGANAGMLEDRFSRLLAAEAWLQSSRPDGPARALGLLAGERTVGLAQLIDGRWETLRAEALWQSGDRLGGLRLLARVLDEAAAVADDDLRLRWLRLRRGWTRVLRDEPGGAQAAEDLRVLIDALLAIVLPEDRAGIEDLRLQEPPPDARLQDPLSAIREALDGDEPADALARIERLPTDIQRDHAVEIAFLRAEALTRAGRTSEAVAVDRGLIERHGKHLTDAQQAAVSLRVLRNLISAGGAEDIVSVADAIERGFGRQPWPADIERAVALARWATDDRERALPVLLAGLRSDSGDLDIAAALLDVRDQLGPEDTVLALTPRVLARPDNATDAELLSNALLDAGEAREAFDVMQRYLVAVHGRIPIEETCRMALWAFELADNAASEGQMTGDTLVDVARRVVQIHVLARQDDHLTAALLDQSIEAVLDPGDRFMILLQCENAAPVVRERAAGYCAKILESQRQQRHPALLRDAALLLDVLQPELLRELVPDPSERDVLKAATERLPLDNAVVCVIGSTPAARRRAFRRLAADHGLVVADQRQIEPFEGHFDMERMRTAVLRQTAQGMEAVDLVVHVPDCESHEVTTALRGVARKAGHQGIDIPVREAAGAGSTSIIRAIEAYFRDLTLDEGWQG